MDKYVKKYIGCKIKEYRECMSLSQEQLAQIVGLTRSSITNIEKGKHTPPCDGLFIFCEVFGVQANDLFPVAKKAQLTSKKVVIEVVKEYSKLKFESLKNK